MAYDEPMTENHTPMRPIRVADRPWCVFGALVGDRDRSRVVREFIAWYIREPGARLPQRPTPQREEVRAG
jgi:hypothetical protein